MISDRIQRRVQFTILVLLMSVAIAAGGVVLANTLYGGESVAGSLGTLRLQVVPHSDRPSDQDLKLHVRNRLITDLQWRVAQFEGTVEEIAAALEQDVDWIGERVSQALQEAGSEQSFRIVFERIPSEPGGEGGLPSAVDAPGGIVVRILLGDARGSNFWCILFPNMCFIPDEAEAPLGTAGASVAEAASPTEDEPTVITQQKDDEAGGVQYRFRLFERIGSAIRSVWDAVAGNPGR